MYMHTYIYTYIPTYILCKHAYTHVYRHTYIHTYMPIYVHTILIVWYNIILSAFIYVYTFLVYMNVKTELATFHRFPYCMWDYNSKELASKAIVLISQVSTIQGFTYTMFE